MSNFQEIVILGPTGNVGSALSRLLVSANIPFRTGNRKDFDYFNPRTYGPLFRGASDLFLLVPFEESLVEVTESLVRAAEKSGIQRIVKLSALGADTFSSSRIQKLHGLADEVLRKSPIPSRILRPNAFMQNFIQFYGKSITHQSGIFLPTGEAKVSFIDADDIAKTAFRAFQEFDSFPKITNLTGPQALSFGEAAETLSKVLNREIRYVPIEEAPFQEKMRSLGIPDWHSASLLELYTSYRRGVAAEVLTHSGNTFENFVFAHKDVWKQRRSA